MDTLKKLSFQNPIVLIDGQCVLCHGFIQFLIKRDKKAVLRFGNLQDYALTDKDYESVILLYKGKIYEQSAAGIRISIHLGGLWRLSGLLLVIPWFIRDWVYGLIAKNRYQWFGKYDECLIPERNILVDSSS